MQNSKPSQFHIPGDNAPQTYQLEVRRGSPIDSSARVTKLIRTTILTIGPATHHFCLLTDKDKRYPQRDWNQKLTLIYAMGEETGTFIRNGARDHPWDIHVNQKGDGGLCNDQQTQKIPRASDAP